jgi:HprK-related kinase A
VTPAFRCLDFEFAIEATDSALQELVNHLYEPCRYTGKPATTFTLEEGGRGGAPTTSLFEGDQRVHVTAQPSLALAYLVWLINRRVVEKSDSMLLLHAAAAEHKEHAVLLPAPSGFGKSTLVAGLVTAGFHYLTDDLCAIAPTNLRAQPYPKPIAIASDTMHLFARADEPLIPESRRRYVGEDAYVCAADLGGTASVHECAVRLVIFPRYAADAPIELRPLSRANTLVMLAEQSFNLDDFGSSALFAIANVLRSCACYQLRYGDIDAAVELISNLLGDGMPAR